MFKTAGEIFEETNFAKLPEAPNNMFSPWDIFNFCSKFFIFCNFQILNPTDFWFFKS